MGASSRTFLPPFAGHYGSVPSVACCTTCHGSTGLQRLSKGNCAPPLESGYNLKAVCQRDDLGYLHSTVVLMQLPHRCRHRCGHVKLPTVECLTLDLLRGMNGVTLNYCYSGDYPTRG